MNPLIQKSQPASLATVLSPVLWLGVSALGFCVGLALLARFDPLFELFVHFAAQYLVAGIVLAVFALLARRTLAFVLALGLGLSNLAPLWPYAFEAPPRIAANGPKLRLVTANLYNWSADAAALQNFLQSTDADIVVLTELTAQQEPAYAAVERKYPHRLRTQGSPHHPFGLLILARRPLLLAMTHVPFGIDYPIVEFRHCADDAGRACVAVIALHATRPGEEFGALRDRMLGFAASRARLAGEAGEQAIVAGDLNVTPWSPAFDVFTGLGLSDAGLGQGWQPTWPTGLGAAGIPIDHVLVSPGLEVRDYRRLKAMNSDHRPLAVELHLHAKP